VQATHLAISSPALLSFVRAYLWQLQRTGAISDGDNSEEQRAAQEAAQALISAITRREQLWPLFAEFKQYVEHQGMGGAGSEQLQAVLAKLTMGAEPATPEPEVNVAPPSQPVEAAPPVTPEPAVDSVDDVAVPSETDSSAAAGDEPDIEPASDAGSDPSAGASDDLGTNLEASSGGDSSTTGTARRRRGRR